MATKIAPDSESPTPVSYKWSIITFSLFTTVLDLFTIFVIMGFPISSPQKGCLTYHTDSIKRTNTFLAFLAFLILAEPLELLLSTVNRRKLIIRVWPCLSPGYAGDDHTTGLRGWKASQR